jgi:hypothetical protein
VLEKPQSLPVGLGACVTLAPEELTQGPSSGTSDLARLRFGLLARPELQMHCLTPLSPARPLPPLRDDRALAAHGDVHLAIALPPEAPARAIERPDPVDLGAGRARIDAASSDLATGIVVELKGEVCGQIAVTASGAAWATPPEALHLTGVSLVAGDAERLAAARVDGAALVRAIEHAPIAIPIAVSALPTVLPELASHLSDDRLTVAATVESAMPETAAVHGAEVLTVVVLRGGVSIRTK